jgi:hypothetical protein
MNIADAIGTKDLGEIPPVGFAAAVAKGCIMVWETLKSVSNNPDKLT